LSSIANSHIDSEVLRSLGGLERWFYAMDRHRPNHFSIAATIEGALAPDALSKSLLALQERHPLLNVAIDGQDTQDITFRRPARSSIPLRTEMRGSESQWCQEIVKESAHPFDTTISPLMRVVLIHGVDRSDLILTIHHSVSDGMGLFFLLRDLMAALSGRTLDAFPLPASIEELRAMPPARENKYESTGEPAPVYEDLRAYRSNSDPAAQLDFLQLSPDKTEQLLRTVRNHGVTIHSALTAALVMAGTAKLTSWQTAPVRIFTPINIRKTNAVGESLTVALGAGVVQVAMGARNTLWETARAAMTDLAYFRQVDQEFTISGMLGQASVDPSQTPAITAQYAYDLILTSPGLIDLTFASEYLRVTDLWGPSVLMGFAGEQSVSALTYDNRLHLTHISTSPIKSLLKDAVDLLLNGPDA